MTPSVQEDVEVGATTAALGVNGAGVAAPAPVAAEKTDPAGDDGNPETGEEDDASARQALSELQALLSNRGMIEPTRPGPAEILPYLLLGGVADAKNVEVLVSLGVTHVLNVAGGEVITGPQEYEQRGIRYSEVVSEDTLAYDIMQHYDEVAQLAEEVASSEPPGRLFVHCFAGVNRSGTLCLAHHMVKSGMPLLKSARHCKAARGRICTNASFQLQLFRFAQKRALPLS